MNQENTPRVTLLVSLLFHAVVLTFMPYLKNIPQKKELTTLEVFYKIASGEKATHQKGGISKELLSVKEKSLPKIPLPEDIQKIKQPPKFDLAELFKPKETISIPKPNLSEKNLRKQKISLKDLPVEMSKDPAYLSYRDIIRKKIQDKIYYYSDRYFYFDNPREGKIFVAFIVSSDGTLKDISIQENNSSQDELLRKIVLVGIKNATPFEKFPKDLNYAERTFNLEISFELE